MTDRRLYAACGLDALTAPLTTREFLERYWPSELFVSHEQLERLEALTRIPALSSIEALLGVTKGKVRVWPPPDSRDEGTRLVAADAALELYRSGWTVYLNEAERSVPALLPFIRRLEAELGLAYGDVASEVFASSTAAGARPHCDFDFGFNVQLQGHKSWHVAPNANFKNPHTSVIISDPFDAEVAAYSRGVLPKDMPVDRATEFVARPGSVVFLPRGYWHTTIAHEPSLALTFARKGMMWSQLIPRELELRLRQLEDFRAFPAATGTVSDSDLQTLRSLLGEVGELIAGLSPSDLLRKWHQPKVPLYRTSQTTCPELLAQAPAGLNGTFVSIAQPDGVRRLLEIPAEHVPIVSAAIRSNIPLSARDVAAIFECSPSTAQATLEALAREGVLDTL